MYYIENHKNILLHTTYKFIKNLPAPELVTNEKLCNCFT